MLPEIRSAGLTTDDTNNGPGFRVSLWIQGCFIRCGGCHNKHLWSFDYGVPISDIINTAKNELSKSTTTGLSILGGEPLQEDFTDLSRLQHLCQFCRDVLHKTVWLWTGRLWEQVKSLPIIQDIDVLVDGPFIEKLRDTSLAYVGSSNQRVIDVVESLNKGKLVLYDKT